MKGVSLSGYERKVGDANQIAELKLAYLLISGAMNEILKEKFPTIIQIHLDLTRR